MLGEGEWVLGEGEWVLGEGECVLGESEWVLGVNLVIVDPLVKLVLCIYVKKSVCCV